MQESKTFKCENCGSVQEAMLCEPCLQTLPLSLRHALAAYDAETKGDYYAGLCGGVSLIGFSAAQWFGGPFVRLHDVIVEYGGDAAAITLHEPLDIRIAEIAWCAIRAK